MRTGTGDATGTSESRQMAVDEEGEEAAIEVRGGEAEGRQGKVATDEREGTAR